MSLSDELAAKDALIAQLTAEKKAQADLVRKQRDIIIQYLVLDIEDYLAEAREKAEEAAAAAAATIITTTAEYESLPESERSTFSKWHQIHRGRYDGVSVHKILRYQLECLWEQWATNPYGLHASWYGMIMVLLWIWLVGSVVCGYYEAAPESGSVRLAKLCRAFLGSIPPIVQFLLFLFPPLFVQF